MRVSSVTITGVLLCGSMRCVLAADWITAPSYFTHDPQTGRRVDQFAQHEPVYIQGRGDYTTSGYRHTRSSIQAGGSVDHLHVVEEWGRPVRPYDEWRYPFRPYSVPYPAWGPQPVPGYWGGGWGGWQGGPGGGNGGGPGRGFGGGAGAWQGGPGGPQAPWNNDQYPSGARSRPHFPRPQPQPQPPPPGP